MQKNIYNIPFSHSKTNLFVLFTAYNIIMFWQINMIERGRPPYVRSLPTFVRGRPPYVRGRPP